VLICPELPVWLPMMYAETKMTAPVTSAAPKKPDRGEYVAAWRPTFGFRAAVSVRGESIKYAVHLQFRSSKSAECSTCSIDADT
jgi:hypothetical protein